MHVTHIIDAAFLMRARPATTTEAKSVILAWEKFSIESVRAVRN